MGRWTQYDEDAYRLPEGMERIGYDTDTMRYHFRDQDGSVWQGTEGAEFGEMTRVDGLPSSVEPPHHQEQPYQPLSTELPPPTADRSTRSYRTLLPLSLLPSSFTGIWSSRREKNAEKAHHPTESSLVTVSGKHRERMGGRLKISKKSIQLSFVNLSRCVLARLPFFRLKSLSRKNFRISKAINSRSVSSRGKQISILRKLGTKEPREINSKVIKWREH